MSDIRIRKWVILATVTLVSFITNVDGTIVITGLPRLMEDLHMAVTTGLWVITAYIISSTVFLLPAGRWSDVVGTKRIFLVGLAIFTVATALCGLAGTGVVLIIDRFIQGLGAALSLATATPIIVRTFEKRELGRALGINATAWVIGSIVGPVAGGALVDAYGWPFIFFVTIPFALVGIVAAAIVLESSKKHIRIKMDWAGIAAFGIALTSLLVALVEGQSWGWSSFSTLGLFSLTVLLIIAFIMIELRVKNPLFDLGLLSHTPYTIGLGITLVYTIGYFATSFLLTLYLQGALKLTPETAGLMLVPLSLPQLVMGPLGGVLADRFGPARIIVVGVFLLAIGVFSLSHLGPVFAIAAIAVPQMIMSVANGLAWPSLSKAVFAAVPDSEAGAASGMFYTMRNVGMALSQTLALVISELSVPPAVASKAFLGTGGVQSHSVKDALVHSTDSGFLCFVVFFAIAFCLALVLLRHGMNRSSSKVQKTISSG